MKDPSAPPSETGNTENVDAPAGPLDWSPVVLAPLLVALALWSVPTAIQAGDAGEFATVMLTGGVPHPSGYPLMRVLGLLARLLWDLGVPPASAAALPPALCGAAAWLLLQRSAAKLGCPWIGAAVVLLAAASPLAVVHVNDSEVWGPHLLLCNTFLFAALSQRPRPLLLGLLLGLALSQHLTAALLVPVAIAAALPLHGRDHDNWTRTLLRNGLLGISGSVLGLLPYASLSIGRGGAWRWGQVETLEGLLHHVLRRDYGTFSLSLHEEEVAASETIARACSSLAEVFSAGTTSAAWAGLVLLLAALGLGAAWLRAQRVAAPDDTLWRPALGIGWLLALLASALLFPSVQNIDPSLTFGAWILERFDLLSVALLVLPVVLALAKLDELVRPALSTRPWIASVGAGTLAFVLLLAQFGAVLEQGRPREGQAVERAAIDLVESPAPQLEQPSPALGPIRAIVFGTDDHRSFPVTYVQAVHGAGAHTLYIDASLLSHPWYRAQLRQRLPSLPDIDKPMRLMGALWSDPQLARVPIYVANVFSAPLARHPRVPEGMLWRVVPPAQFPHAFDPAAWTPTTILTRHLAACQRLTARPTDFEVGARDPWSGDLQFAYVEKARALARALAAQGESSALAAVAACLEAHTGQKELF